MHTSYLAVSTDGFVLCSFRRPTQSQLQQQSLQCCKLLPSLCICWPLSAALSVRLCRLNTGEVKAFFEPNGPAALTFFFQVRPRTCIQRLQALCLGLTWLHCAGP